MMVLVIPQAYTSVFFVFDFILFLVYQDYFLLNWVLEGLKKSNNFWLACALVEAEAGQGTGNCMPCHLSYEMPYQYS